MDDVVTDAAQESPLQFTQAPGSGDDDGGTFFFRGFADGFAWLAVHLSDGGVNLFCKREREREKRRVSVSVRFRLSV